MSGFRESQTGSSRYRRKSASGNKDGAEREVVVSRSRRERRSTRPSRHPLRILHRISGLWLVIGGCLCCSIASLFPQGIEHVEKYDILPLGRYEGDVLGAYYQGKGTLVFQNGDVYTGDFSGGVFHGKGTYRSKEGWTYEGDFSEGMPSSQGSVTIPGGQ